MVGAHRLNHNFGRFSSDSKNQFHSNVLIHKYINPNIICIGIVFLYLQAHRQLVYSAAWAPRSPGMLCSCSADGSVALWDIRNPDSQRPALVFRVSTTEVLNADWSKYDCNMLATGSIDSSVSLWDIRQPAGCRQKFFHKMAVRKVRTKFMINIVASIFLCLA